MSTTETDAIAPPDPHRYTLDGDAAVEARIERDQQRIAAAVARVVPEGVFRALVLMGGYGRGEGGYRLVAGRPEPYNDYDYFVVARGLGRPEMAALAPSLAATAHGLRAEVGVEVDFALLREEALPQAEFSLMNAEMLWGHKVIRGDPDILRAMPPMPFQRLPPGEIVRLLLNRGSLLLMNQQALVAGATLAGEDKERFFKYLFKAVLACGDARLAGNGCYHPSYPAKFERLRRLSWPGQAEFLAIYEQALATKFHPEYSPYLAADALGWQARVVRYWLETLSWFESVRTGRPIPDWSDYVGPRLGKGQGRRWGLLRNIAVTLRDFGLAEMLRHPLWALRYPRERLIGALPILLSYPGEPVPEAVAAALALSPGTPWTQAAEVYLRWWSRYS